MIAESFNIETADADWAGTGRQIEITREDTGLVVRRQMKIVVGAWTLSCIWGTGAYCIGARGDGPATELSPEYIESPDCEVAAWRVDGRMIEIDGDTVQGWVSPAALSAAIDAAEADDQDGIRVALTAEQVAA